MMTKLIQFPAIAQVPPHNAVRRGVAAGCAWGAIMGTGLTALAFRDCGMICLTDVAMTTGLSMAAGILTIGPLAAFGRRLPNSSP
jgi:Mg/Co/Ni transporter MgtE